MFGIELRRTGNIKNILSDVDVILKRAGVTKGELPAEIQRSAVAHSLQKMLTGKWFDICTINSCVELCHLIIPSERMAFYRTQHCIHYDEMLPEHRAVLYSMILDDFREVLNPDLSNPTNPMIW